MPVWIDTLSGNYNTKPMRIQQELEKELDELKHDLKIALTSENVCEIYNVDSREEIVSLLQEDINLIELKLSKHQTDEEYWEEQEERRSLCLSQGLYY